MESPSDKDQTEPLHNEQIESASSEEQMESSTDALLAEWDVVNSINENAEKNVEEENQIENEPERTANETVEETMTVGSGVDEVSAEMVESANYNESNSSSDIDIIDEPNMEDSHLSNISIPSMQLSLSASVESEASTSAAEPIQPEVSQPASQFRFSFGINVDTMNIIKLCLIGIVLSVTIVYVDQPLFRVFKLQEKVNILHAENIELKTKVLSKIEDDKLFLLLEEQVAALKQENTKLSESMHNLIQQLEQQTHNFIKENDLRDKSPYKKELDTLKEQINLLRIDNDELQQQLVRLRYTQYQPYDGESAAGVSEDKTSSVDMENLAKEILDLKQKIFDEVHSFNHWKESVKETMLKMGPKFKEWWSGVDSENFKVSPDDYKKFKKEKHNNWSWKALKKSLKSTMDRFNVSELFNKYVKMDNKKVTNAMETVGYYFRKAHDKAQKVFEEDMKPDVLEFLGELRKKWDDLTDRSHHPSKSQRESYEDPKNSDEGQRTHKDSHLQHEDVSNEMHSAQKMDLDKNSPKNSWVFKRAAQRSEERHQEQEKEETNWFLQRRQDEEGTRKKNLGDQQETYHAKRGSNLVLENFV